MSVFLWNAGDYAVDYDTSSEWTNGLNITSQTIQNDGTDNYLYFNATGGTRSMIMFDAAGQVQDCEILLTFSCAASNFDMAFFTGLQSSTYNYTASTFGVKNESNEINISYRLNGSAQSSPAVSSTDTDLASSVKYNVRIYSVGAVQKFKIWPYGTSEPTAYNIETADGPSLTGSPALFTYNGDPFIYEYNVYTGSDIGTGSIDDGSTSEADLDIIIDQDSVQPGDVITFTTLTMTDGNAITITDTDLDSVTVSSIINNGDNTYSATIPALDNGLNVLMGTVSVALTNGTETTDSASIELLPPDGYTEISAIEQSASLSAKDWGYGQSVSVGQKFLGMDVAGVTYINNGLTLIDNSLFTSGAVGGYLQAPTLKTWEEIAVTLVASDGNLAPTVTIQNTSFSVPYGTVWSDSLLGTITTSDDSDTVTYTVDSSAYIANTAGTYEITVTTSADSGGLTGTASAFVTVEAEVVAVAKVTIPKLKSKSGSNVSTSGTYKIYSDIALTSLVATGAFNAYAGYDVEWDQEELTSGSTYYVLMYDTNGEFSLRKVVAS